MDYSKPENNPPRLERGPGPWSPDRCASVMAASPLRLKHMGILRLLGLLMACGAPAAMAQFAWDNAEWPKTDFSRRTVELREI